MVHLHNRTIYSARRSLVKPDAIVNAAVASEHSHLAITDICNLHGSVEFYKECSKGGINPIIGCSIYVTDDESPNNRGSLVTLLVKNKKGYKNLCDLITHGNLTNPFFDYLTKQHISRVTFSDLEKYSGGLICYSGPDGHIESSLADGNEMLEQYYHQKLKRIFGEDFYVMISPQKQIGVNYLTQNYKNIIIGSDIKYMEPHLGPFHVMFDAILHNRKWPQIKNQQPQALQFLTDEDIRSSFGIDVSYYMDQTNSIAEQCKYKFNTKDKFPKIWVDDADAYLKERINIGYQKVKHEFPQERRHEYLNRLREEYEIISKMGFSSYFIVVEDAINFCREKGIMVGSGRGSAGGSLSCYVLGIHQIDSIKHNCHMARFLNENRTSPPDLDIDIQDNRREELIDYLTEKYGQDKVAGIGNIVKLALRSAMKDVGRVLQVPSDEMNELTKFVPKKAETFADCMKHKWFAEEYERNSLLRDIMRYANPIVGTMQHVGKHAAGLVISPDPITNYTPLQIDHKSGRQITQFDKKAIEHIGLIKFDFLGLTALSTMNNCLASIDAEINIDKMEMNDPAIFKEITNGNTTGIFQLESPGMTEMAQRMKVEKFEDIRDLVALYRPAVLVVQRDKNGKTLPSQADIYFNNKENPIGYKSLHSLLDEHLKNTNYIMLFQEQMMTATNVLAGFSLAEADDLRRAIGKKDAKLMAKLTKKFANGCKNNGIDQKTIDEILNIFDGAVGYGFNVAHSVGYAIISYQTAWLKHYYSLNYMTALFNSEINNQDKFFRIADECLKLDLKILPPCVNKSNPEFTIEDGKIRFGLAAIKGVGFDAAQDLVEKRGNLLYESVYSFIERTGITKKYLEVLADAGALDSFGVPREKITANSAYLVRFYKKLDKGNFLIEPEPELVEVEMVSPYSLSLREKELCGVSFI